MGMTRFLLIRHGAHLLGHGKIPGRMAGVHLSPDGHAQAARLAERIGHLPIKAIYCSPLERTRETAQPLADRLGLPVEIRESLIEIGVGDWSGHTLDDLRKDDRWRRWNIFRSLTRAPNGELMLEAQLRVLAEMHRLREQHPDDTIALVTHGDVIKSAVAYFLGMPLDLFLRLEISLASVSVVAVGDDGPWVLCVNNTGEVVMG